MPPIRHEEQVEPQRMYRCGRTRRGDFLRSGAYYVTTYGWMKSLTFIAWECRYGVRDLMANARQVEARNRDQIPQPMATRSTRNDLRGARNLSIAVRSSLQRKHSVYACLTLHDLLELLCLLAPNGLYFTTP